MFTLLSICNALYIQWALYKHIANVKNIVNIALIILLLIYYIFEYILDLILNVFNIKCIKTNIYSNILYIRIQYILLIQKYY